jgi:hypothetical protein
LQKKTGTLTGRELSKSIEVQPMRNTRRKEKKPAGNAELTEYQWRIRDDDDDLKEDVLAPKYSSF